MSRMFRLLRADEIECRVQTCNKKGVSLLLYKDARCDMNILDETVGAEFWQRYHNELKGNIYCGVGIFNTNLDQWIIKWDAGAESYTEKEKGEASDSFKRACVNWGIGRELYTSPFIWINGCTEEKDGKYICKDSFKVSAIEYENDSVSYLLIRNKRGEVVYTYGVPEADKTPRMMLTQYCKEHGLDLYEVAEKYEINKQSTDDDILFVLDTLKAGE